MIVPVVLSGGSGTRLWPLSTPDRPKQFLPLTGSESLFRQTLQRVVGEEGYAPPVIVSNETHEVLCQEESLRTPGQLLILEPLARNTAAAIVMAAVAVEERYGSDALMLVMPSDHRIGDARAFHRAVATAVEAARKGRLVTFGIQPTGPETGYGYLEAGDPIADAPGASAVLRFTEKPQAEVAERMVADGRHFWNGGLFMFGAGAFLAEAQRQAPDIAGAAVASMEMANSRDDVIRPDRRALEACPNVSVDYAVMERSSQVAMVPLQADWSDVGSWDAVAALANESGSSEVVTAAQSRNCYVHSDKLKVSLLGVDDLIVVATGDRVLIMRKGESQRVRELVS